MVVEGGVELDRARDELRPAASAAAPHQHGGDGEGVGAAVGVTPVAEGVAAGDVFGDFMALAAAAGFACFSVVIRRGRQTDMLPSVFYAGVMSGTLAAVGGVTLGIGLEPSYWDIGVSFAYGAIGISGGLVLYTLGSRYVPAAELNVLSLGEVVLAPLWVWLACSETPTGFTLAGGLIILVAVVVQARGAWQPTDEGP